MNKKITFTLKNGKEISLEDDEIQELYQELHKLIGKKEVEYIPPSYTPLKWKDIYDPPFWTYTSDGTKDWNKKPSITIT